MSPWTNLSSTDIDLLRLIPTKDRKSPDLIGDELDVLASFAWP